MKTHINALLFMFLGCSSILGQTIDYDRLGIGFNIGGQKIYGDKEVTGFGIGLESYFQYRIINNFNVTAALGYGELSDGTFHLDKSTFTTDMINFDLKGSYLIPSPNIFKPNVYLGLGVFNFKNERFAKRFFDGSFFFGGGLEIMLNSQIALTGCADYRFTTGDDLDFTHAMGKSKDGYFNIRTGITYYLTPQTGASAGSKVLADGEKAPIDEIGGSYDENIEEVNDDELSALIEGIDNFDEASSSEYTMDEYIKLKSRIEQLNDNIQQKELEIEELRAQLSTRQEKVAELEDRMRTRGGALAASLNMEIGDFSTNYEQGLENFYAQEYDAAIYVFNSILDAYPNHSLASNCQYWIGECYFGKQNYESAIDAFELVLNYENSVKKDDALLMMGRSYIKMDNRQLATETFQRLMNDYPDSEYFYKAEQYTNNL